MADNFGAVNAADAGTLALLYGGGFGRGIGVGYGGYGGIGIANPTATFAGVNRNAMDIQTQNQCTRDILSTNEEANRIAVAELARNMADDVTRSEMSTGFANIANSHLQDVIQDGNAALANERRQSDLFMNLNNQINDFRAESAKCCCDTKILVLEENGKTRDLINARALQDTQRDLDRCLQEKQTQTILAAMPNGNGACL